MPNLCKVWASPHRETIDLLLASGLRTPRSLSEEFGVPYKSVVRHRAHEHFAAQGPTIADAQPRPQAPRPTPEAATLPDTVAETFRQAYGLEPKGYQLDYWRLAADSDLVVLKARQAGFSLAAAALAIHTARSEAGPDVVIVSPTQRQSSEVGFKARTGLWGLGETLAQDSATVLRLENGSRIVLLAGSPRSVRGYSARLLIVDEAFKVADEVWEAAAPMTAATRGRTVVQSTPGYPVGFFYDLWSDPEGWATLRVAGEDALDEAYLAERRRRLTPQVYAMEYGASFADVADSSWLWSKEEWDALIVPNEVKA